MRDAEEGLMGTMERSYREGKKRNLKIGGTERSHDNESVVHRRY